MLGFRGRGAGEAGKSLQKPQTFQKVPFETKCCICHGKVAVMEVWVRFPQLMGQRAVFTKFQIPGQYRESNSEFWGSSNEFGSAHGTGGLTWTWLKSEKAAECTFLMNREECAPLQILAQLAYWPSRCSKNKAEEAQKSSPWNVSLEGQQQARCFSLHSNANLIKKGGWR